MPETPRPGDPRDHRSLNADKKRNETKARIRGAALAACALDTRHLPSIEDIEAPAGTLAGGVAAIQRAIKHAPSGPGVYRMFDQRGEVLYVGKAKSIRKRITSYARDAGHTARIGRMIAATASIEFVTTATETEALLLEANLIKRLRPRFNVLLRDDKSFPYILITAGEDRKSVV